jgi:hypothetical protein
MSNVHNLSITQLTNAIHSSNGARILHALPRFDLYHDNYMFICRFEVIGGTDAPDAMSEWTSKAAPASRREATVGYDLPRLLSSGDLRFGTRSDNAAHSSETTHHRNKHAPCASIKRILDLPRRTVAESRSWNSHERTRRVGPKTGDGLDRLCGTGLERCETVLAIYHHPREVWAGLCDRACVQHAWQGDPCAECGLGGLECLQECVGRHGWLRLEIERVQSGDKLFYVNC